MGRGKGDLAIPFSEGAAVYTLNVLIGAVNRSGGVFLKSEGGLVASWPRAALDGIAEKGLAQPRLDSIGSSKFPAGQPNYTQFFSNAAQQTPYPINLLMLHEANPAFQVGGGSD